MSNKVSTLHVHYIIIIIIIIIIITNCILVVCLAFQSLAVIFMDTCVCADSEVDVQARTTLHYYYNNYYYIIITFIIFMQGIYNYIPETRVHSVAAVLYLQFVPQLMSFRT